MGFSGGARMSSRLACDFIRPDAAIARLLLRLSRGLSAKSKPFHHYFHGKQERSKSLCRPWKNSPLIGVWEVEPALKGG